MKKIIFALILFPSISQACFVTPEMQEQAFLLADKDSNKKIAFKEYKDFRKNWTDNDIQSTWNSMIKSSHKDYVTKNEFFTQSPGAYLCGEYNN